MNQIYFFKISIIVFLKANKLICCILEKYYHGLSFKEFNMSVVYLSKIILFGLFNHGFPQINCIFKFRNKMLLLKNYFLR